jgi:iron complex transport system substrate-binding protein
VSNTKIVPRLSLLLATVALIAVLGVNTLFAEETSSCEAGLRLFTHAMGETCIPETPQRIVVLDTGELDNALALGATIVGAPVTEALQYQAYLDGQLDGISDIGSISEPNLEAILALTPDLILGSKQRYEAIYEQLTQIAPTALTESLRVPWQDNFRFHAEALGKTAEAEQLLADYDAHIAEVQAVLGDSLDTTTVSIIRFRPGQVRLYLKSSYIGYILQDVGLQRPTSQDEDVFSAEISIEQLQDADADYVFVTGYDVDDSERDTFLNSPLWQTLEAVQNERVIDVNDDTWIAGLGVQAANLVLDDLKTLLAVPAEAEITAAAFPITVEHKFGSTIIPAAPQRVVSIGFSDQDPLLALGVKPVAVRYWYGDTSNAIFPWAQDEAEGAQPVVLDMPFGSLNYEAILALKPDLISAVYSGITQEEYETLSQIAPVIAQSADYTDFGMPWQETTRLIGAALGKSDEAEALVSNVETLIADARTQNPGFAGKSVAVVYSYGGGSYGYYTAQDPRGRFFTDLGFVVPDDLNEIAGDSYYADISPERVDLLDRDLLVMVGLQFVEGGREEIESDPLISQLDAVQEGRVLYVANDADDALQFSTVLSLEYALEGVVPQVQAIVGSETVVDVSAQETLECEPGFRLFDHEYLDTDPVCIPENPQRVLAMDMAALEFLLYTDKEIVGSMQWILEEMIASLPPLSDRLTAITDVGYPVDSEVVLAAQPDLILAYGGDEGSFSYEELSAIAPVVTTSLSVEDWERTTQFWAEVLNEEAIFEDMKTTYYSRIAELQQALGDARAETEVSLVSATTYGLSLWMSDSPQGKILGDIGFIRPEPQILNEAEGVYWLNISEEHVNLGDGDVIFLFAYATTDPEIEAKENQTIIDFQQNPLWQSLEGVKSGQVYVMPGYWWRASTYLLANYIIDDIFDALTDTQATTPHPVTAFEDPEIEAEATESSG